MNAITISNVAIRQTSNNLYNLNDLHKASGGEKRHEITNWLKLQQTNELIAEIWTCFYESDPEELIYLYKKQSLVLGRQVSFHQNNQTYKGIARDISDSGQLLVQLGNGQEIWLNSGEVSLISW